MMDLDKGEEQLIIFREILHAGFTFMS